MEGPGGERASRGDFRRLMGLMMSSKETEMATTQEVGRSASLAGGQLGVEVAGWRRCWKRRAWARGSGAGQGSTEQPRAGGIRLAAPPRANAVHFVPAPARETPSPS